MYSERNRMASRWWVIIPVSVLVAVAAVIIGVSLYVRSMVTSYWSVPAVRWWFGGPFFGLGWLFVIPMIFIIFFAFRWFLWGFWGYGCRSYAPAYADPAFETVRQRFARGEITKEQFEQMTRDLQQH